MAHCQAQLMRLSLLQAADGIPDIPAELLRRYLVVVKPQTKSPTMKLREIGARHVGQLVSVKVGLECYLATHWTVTCLMHCP